MRRAIPAVAATAAGLAAVLAYKTGPAPRLNLTVSSKGSTTTTSSSSSESPLITRPTPTTPATSATTVAPARTYDGPTEDTRFGPVQVAATIKGGRITDVQALQLPSSHQRSQYISQQAAPELRIEALNAQSANIDTISGATYTSDAYAQSLQAALDAAHFTS